MGSEVANAIETELLSVDSLTPYAKNPRTGDVEAIKESLTVNGQYRAIVVRAGTNEVLAGNHTLAAAKALGWSELLCHVVDVDDEQAARIVLVDNRSNDLATYDYRSLLELLQSLPDTEGTGYSQDALDDLLGKLTVLEPGADTEANTKLSGDQIGTDIYAEVMPSILAASDEKAALYLWHADTKNLSVHQALNDAGYEIRAQIIWVKNMAQFGAIGAQYKQKHEACFYAFRKGSSPRWVGPNNEVTVWEAARASSNDYHPTQKPVELAERAITNSCSVNEIVLDFFGGSGSTLIASENLQRKCYAMELDPGYCDVIIDRWERHTGQKAELVDA